MRTLLSWVLVFLGLMAFAQVFLPHPHDRIPPTFMERLAQNPIGAAFIPLFVGSALFLRRKSPRDGGRG